MHMQKDQISENKWCSSIEEEKSKYDETTTATMETTSAAAATVAYAYTSEHFKQIHQR